MLHFAARLLARLPAGLRRALLRGFRNAGGRFGLGVRYLILASLCRSMGDNVSVHPGVFIFAPENLAIGDNVSIHPMCYIDATGEISIGNDVSIAHTTTIMSTEHRFERLDLPTKDQGVSCHPAVIEDDVWLGAHVTVLAGVRVSRGCIVGAGSVVTKDTAPGGIYGGVPARLLKARS